ncbi:MAG: aminoglycoside adenylyltransferase domain-containing protein [Saprospiraceae bacterium]
MNQTDFIVTSLANDINGVLPDFVDGFYLTGSISLLDFYPQKSDIDFLIICRELPNELIVEKLKHIHKGIAKQFPHPELSGHYLTTETVESKTPEKMKVLTYHQGHMKYETFDMAPIYLWELKQNAITVFGKPNEELKINITHDDLNNFLYRNINSYWNKWITQHSSFGKRKILLISFPRFTEWVILGIARQLFTLQTGKIISKSEAGYYALQHLPVKYHPILQKAIEIRKDVRSQPILRTYRFSPSLHRADETIECARYMISIFNSIYLEVQS